MILMLTRLLWLTPLLIPALTGLNVAAPSLRLFLQLSVYPPHAQSPSVKILDSIK